MRKTTFTLMTLFLLLNGIFSCKSSSNSEEDWCHSINELVEKNKQLIYSEPNKLIELLENHPVSSIDTLRWYYRLAQYARCYYFAGLSDSAQHYIDEIKRYGSRSRPTPALHTVLAVTYNIEAVIHQSMNNRDSAYSQLEKAYWHVSRADNRKEAVNISINAADVSKQLGNLPQSAAWYHRAMQLADSLNLITSKHAIQVGLGSVYSELQNYTQAHRHFALADSTYPPSTPYEKYVYYNTLGNCYYFEKRYNDALRSFRCAYEIVKPFKQPLTSAIVETNLGELFLELGNQDSAHFYLKRAEHYFLTVVNADDAILFYINGLYASIYLNEGNLWMAKKYLSTPFDTLRIGPSYLYLHHKRMKEYHTQLGNYQEALQNLEWVNKYDDSLRQIRYLNTIEESEYRHRQDTALLNRNIMIATSQSKASRLQLLTMLSMALLLLTWVGSMAIYNYIRRRNENKRREQLSLITQLRMENVRNRFSPHFVFNVLNALLSSLSAEESKTAPLHLLIKVLRSNLLTADKIAIPLSEEVELVKNYATICLGTDSEKASIEWHIDPIVDLSQRILSMIIQIPVENAIKHAFPPEASLKEDPYIRITITRERENGTLITIEDNGVGYLPHTCCTGKQRANDTGTGIRIIYRTIELLNKKNSTQMEFKIVNRSTLDAVEQGTKVTICIPYNYNFNL